MNLINNRPSLRQIEAFLAVAEAGSFSAAARKMAATQPALSQAVRELEDQLALRLFTRTTRRVDLTAAGAALRDRLAMGLDVLDDALARARDLAQLRSGHLRIAAPPLLASTVLARLIASFAARHPGLSFDLADVVSAEIPQLVRRGLADVGVGTFVEGEAGLDRRVLLGDVMSLVCRHDHPLAQGPVAWADLAGQRLIGLDRASGLRRLADRGLDMAGLDLAPVITVHQVATALALVQAGMGVAVFPRYAVHDRGESLSCQPLEAPRLKREVVMVTAADHAPSPVAEAFQRHLMQGFAAAYRREGGV